MLMLRDKDLKDLVQKAGFDDGKSFLKLTMTLYDPEDIIPCDGTFVKRASKPEHILAGQNNKDTGVNILGIVVTVNIHFLKVHLVTVNSMCKYTNDFGSTMVCFYLYLDF